MSARTLGKTLMVALAVAGAGQAQAAVLHRCLSADGSIAWRDAPCPPNETALARREFADPAPVANAAAAGEAPIRTPRTVQARAGPRAKARAADRIVAHECRYGEQRWVQAEACPKRMESGDKAVAVHEARLTEGQVCDALRGLSAAQSRGEGSSRRAYAMNRLRQRHGC